MKTEFDYYGLKGFLESLDSQLTKRKQTRDKLRRQSEPFNMFTIDEAKLVKDTTLSCVKRKFEEIRRLPSLEESVELRKLLNLLQRLMLTYIDLCCAARPSELVFMRKKHYSKAEEYGNGQMTIVMASDITAEDFYKRSKEARLKLISDISNEARGNKNFRYEGFKTISIHKSAYLLLGEFITLREQASKREIDYIFGDENGDVSEQTKKYMVLSKPLLEIEDDRVVELFSLKGFSSTNFRKFVTTQGSERLSSENLSVMNKALGHSDSTAERFYHIQQTSRNAAQSSGFIHDLLDSTDPMPSDKVISEAMTTSVDDELPDLHLTDIEADDESGVSATQVTVTDDTAVNDDDDKPPCGEVVKDPQSKDGVPVLNRQSSIVVGQNKVGGLLNTLPALNDEESDHTPLMSDREIASSEEEDKKYINHVQDLDGYRLAKRILFKARRPNKGKFVFSEEALCYVARSFVEYTRTHNGQFPKNANEVPVKWLKENALTADAVRQKYRTITDYIEKEGAAFMFKPTKPK